MKNNLLLITQYINNNIKFGSELGVRVIFDLFNKYPISKAEKPEVWKELESLDIRLLYPTKLSDEEIFELLNRFSSEKKIYETDLIDWFNKANFSYERQEQIMETIYSSNYVVVNNEKKTYGRLSFILFYIDNNIRYGSKVVINEIFDLFHKFPIPDSKKRFVWKELDSLNVELINQDSSLKKEILNFLKYLSSEEKVYESKLRNWFNKENINQEDQIQIRQILNYSKYKIVDDVQEKSEIENLNFLADFDDESLDELLDSADFNKEVSGLEDIADKSYNNEYLYDYKNSNDRTMRGVALQKIVKANKKLVWSIVLKYKKFSTAAYDYNDMFQSGMQGLLRAAEKFDFSKDTQFSTYATFWIRQSISRGIGNYSTAIRIPIHLREEITNYIKVENKFWDDNGRIATKKELSKILGISKEKVKNLQTYKKLSNLSSLESYVGPDNDSTLDEFISENTIPSPEYYLEKDALREEIESLFDEELSDKEALVLKMRYGFTDGKKYTLEEIGKLQNVTRERIRQIQEKALTKLKKRKTKKRLGEFYYD